MIRVAAFYQFARIEDRQAVRDGVLAVCEEAGTKGTILVAHEGVNGTIAGSAEGVAAVLAHLRTLPGCAGLEHKDSTAATMPFYRMKVRLKAEIVTMGQPDLDPTDAGTYVPPAQWNALIADPDTVVIDTRNDYEVAVGTFAGAIDPATRAFSEFPAWFRDHRAELLKPGAKVAMFCTGGIRCEKSTAFLKAEGVENVFHLQGGILKYLEEVPAAESLWEGECFVFDQRVAVGQGLEQGSHVLCHACRMPVDVAGQASPLYVEGISCPACHATRDDDQRARYAERQRQAKLSEERGEAHLGAKHHGPARGT